MREFIEWCGGHIWLSLVGFIAIMALISWLARRIPQPAPPRWLVGSMDGTELEAKNEAQAKQIAGYIALIEAAKGIGVHFHWEGRTAHAELPREQRIENESLWKLAHELDAKCREVAGEKQISLEQFKAESRRDEEWTASDVAPKWPQLCRLCNRNMESETDRIEWHGLGNCVPICPTCCGSGTAEEIARMLPPETVFDAARRLIEMRAELIDLEKHIEHHQREEFTSCEKCDSYPAKNSEYQKFCEQWAVAFALFAGHKVDKSGRDGRTAEGGRATRP